MYSRSRSELRPKAESADITPTAAAGQSCRLAQEEAPRPCPGRSIESRRSSARPLQGQLGTPNHGAVLNARSAQIPHNYTPAPSTTAHSLSTTYHPQPFKEARKPSCCSPCMWDARPSSRSTIGRGRPNRGTAAEPEASSSRPPLPALRLALPGAGVPALPPAGEAVADPPPLP